MIEFAVFERALRHEIKKRLAKCPLSAVSVWLNVCRLLPLHTCEVPAKEIDFSTRGHKLKTYAFYAEYAFKVK